MYFFIDKKFEKPVENEVKNGGFSDTTNYKGSVFVVELRLCFLSVVHGLEGFSCSCWKLNSCIVSHELTWYWLQNRPPYTELPQSTSFSPSTLYPQNGRDFVMKILHRTYILSYSRVQQICPTILKFSYFFAINKKCLYWVHFVWNLSIPEYEKKLPFEFQIPFSTENPNRREFYMLGSCT